MSWHAMGLAHIVTPHKNHHPFQLLKRLKIPECGQKTQLLSKHVTGFPTNSFGNDETKDDADIWV